jgi:hypothetical protein
MRRVCTGTVHWHALSEQVEVEREAVTLNPQP